LTLGSDHMPEPPSNKKMYYTLDPEGSTGSLAAITCQSQIATKKWITHVAQRATQVHAGWAMAAITCQSHLSTKNVLKTWLKGQHRFTTTGHWQQSHPTATEVQKLVSNKWSRAVGRAFKWLLAVSDCQLISMKNYCSCAVSSRHLAGIIQVQTKMRAVKWLPVAADYQLP
jgi:hypothetical protein